MSLNFSDGGWGGYGPKFWGIGDECRTHDKSKFAKERAPAA